MRNAILVALVLSFFTIAGHAQTSTLPCSSSCSLSKNQPFSVVYDWAPTTLNPDMADGFRLYQDGVTVRSVDISGLVNGSVRFDFSTGLSTAKVYTFSVSAYTTGGETVGDAITLTIVKGKPAKPINGRLQ